MTRDGLPRAYLRIDPNLDQTHPDPGVYVRLLCAAARQPDRGRFRDRALLERTLGKAKVRALVERHDIEEVAGRLYVVGWDEWQEGDMTVAERMRRMRERRQRNRVTPPPSHDRIGVTTDASKREGERSSSSGVGVGVDSPPPPVERGKRKDGTNPRANGTAPRDSGDNPRARGTSPRQERQRQKRDPTPIHEILSRVNRGPA